MDRGTCSHAVLRSDHLEEEFMGRLLDAKGGARLRIVSWAVRSAVAGGALACAATGAEGAITKLVVTRLESPTFGGTYFDGVGQYEKITARAYGEVDPAT